MQLVLRPVVGAMVRLHGEARVIEGYGRTFLLDSKTARVWGTHLHGQEGRPCCYAYTRVATPAETAVLKDYEAAIEAARSRLPPLGRARMAARNEAATKGFGHHRLSAAARS